MIKQSKNKKKKVENQIAIN